MDGFHRPTVSRTRDAITHRRDNRICSLMGRSAKAIDVLLFSKHIPIHNVCATSLAVLEMRRGRLISGDTASANENAQRGCARRRGALSSVANNTPSPALDTEKLGLSAFLEARNRHRRRRGVSEYSHATCTAKKYGNRVARRFASFHQTFLIFDHAREKRDLSLYIYIRTLVSAYGRYRYRRLNALINLPILISEVSRSLVSRKNRSLVSSESSVVVARLIHLPIRLYPLYPYLIILRFNAYVY